MSSRYLNGLGVFKGILKDSQGELVGDFLWVTLGLKKFMNGIHARTNIFGIETPLKWKESGLKVY